MQSSKIKTVLLLAMLITSFITSCNSSKATLINIYKDHNKHQAFYINLFINFYEYKSNDINFGDDICCDTQDDFMKSSSKKSSSVDKKKCYSYPKNLNYDSLSVIQYILNNMVVGGETNFMENYLLSTTDGSGNYFSQHHNRRVDFAILYYIYYDFYLKEDTSKFHNIILVNNKDSLAHCYPTNTPPFYGPPSSNLNKEAYQNSMISSILECYKIWLSEIKQIGYTKSKEMNKTPFTKCSCHFRRIPNDKEHFSRFPRTE